LTRAVKVVFVLLVAAAAVAYYLAAPKGSGTRGQLPSTGEADAGTSGCGRPIAAAERAIRSATISEGGTFEPEVDQAMEDLGVHRLQVRESSRHLVDSLYEEVTRLAATTRPRDDKAVNAVVDDIATKVAALHRVCAADAPGPKQRLRPGAQKTKHVIFIMQENRSFDHYFGTFPGADGIPMKQGVPTVCLPNPAINGCSRPHHSYADYDHGGPHTYEDALADINHGKMDGFVRRWQTTRAYCNSPGNGTRPTCLTESLHPDVLSYHDARDIPNYWQYASDFVLQDHMFQSNMGWSAPSHLAMVSGWSAACKSPYLPFTCRPSVQFTDIDNAFPDQPSFAWTDLTYLLHKHGVSWRYYVAPGSVKDCEGTDDEIIHCKPGSATIGTPEPWNPLPDFTTVRENKQVDNVQFHPRFFDAARRGKLAAVTWVVPGWNDSEHPPSLVSDGQAWVTKVVNAVMTSPDWKNSAIFVTWDDWGGFYDHVVPPSLDEYSYGLRVPGFMISPYAKKGMVDHQTLSYDAYLKFVEDLFLDGARLDPFTDGRWDPRPRVVEDDPRLGDLMAEFDFTQPPREPVILEPYPSG
jgi:phospholipase C